MRGWRLPAIGIAALAAVLLLGVNVSGVAPVPVGPLGDHQPAVPDSARSTLDYQASRSAIYLSPFVENTWPVPVTIVRVTPVGTTVPASVEVLGSLPFNSDDPAEQQVDGSDRVMLGIREDPGPAWAHPQAVTDVTVEPKGKSVHEGRAFLVRITPDPTQETGVLRFDVEYTIGPFHFVTTALGPLGTTVLVCPRDRPHPAGSTLACSAESS
jgi:hypothetical protein